MHFVERGADGDLMLGGEVAHGVGLERDAAHEADRRAEIARRLHQVLAPPAEADDCGVEHARSGRRRAGLLHRMGAREGVVLPCTVSTMRLTVGNGAMSTLK